LQLIANWQVDNSFHMLSKDNRAVCRIMRNVNSMSFGIELWQQRQDYPWLHLFIPPDRSSIAIEPVSSGINAFNSGEGLRWLEPGEQVAMLCGIRALHFA